MKILTMNKILGCLGLSLALGGSCLPAFAQTTAPEAMPPAATTPDATAELYDAQGNRVGMVELTNEVCLTVMAVLLSCIPVQMTIVLTRQAIVAVA